MTKRKTKPPAPKTQTYASRAARGRPLLTISVSAECKALLARLSAARYETRGETVENALLLLESATPTPRR